MAVLVTGGAGYIGSHMAWALLDAGEEVVVLDRLSTGFRWAVPAEARFYLGDVGDRAVLSQIFAENDINAILHFAGSIVVPQSVANPLDYYENNTGNTRLLAAAAIAAGIRHFVFSSTAAVYGDQKDDTPVFENADLHPKNPYGQSKLMSEMMLRDAAAAHDFRFVALRYFNVAGSDTQGRIGQSTRAATLLVKVACEVAVGKRPHLSVFGTDYPTPDGTGVRDYIHVEDLASAHVNALTYLREGGRSLVANCGYGHGYSVREVISSVEKIAGIKLAVREEPRRAGDPPSLVARVDKVREQLGWSPRLDDIDLIVRSSLEWERRLQREPW